MPLVHVRAGGAISLLVGLLAALALIPASASAFSKAIWVDSNHSLSRQFSLFHRLGVSIVEEDLEWNRVATRRPATATNPRDRAYRWPKTIAQSLRLARRYHMRLLLQVIGTPAWANGGKDSTWVPNQVSDFAAFTTAAAREYPSVHLWMIWGEPDNLVNFQPLVRLPYDGAHPQLTPEEVQGPHDYARLLDAAYGAIKHVSRRNRVIGGSSWTSGDFNTYDWVQNLVLPNGRPPRMDMYAHNPFTERDPNFSNPQLPEGAYDFSDLKRFASLLDHHFRKKLPLFLSEWTIPTASDQEFQFWVDPRVAAHWITDALRLSRSWHRIYALGWIHVYDSLPRTTGGLLTSAGRRKPTFYAFAH